MFRISDELKVLFESGVAVLVGSASKDGQPHVAYGWGPKVGPGGESLTVFLDAKRAEATIANVGGGGPIAVTVCSVVSYQSVQVKGRCTGVREPGEDEKAWVERHREVFLTATALVGDPPDLIPKLWMRDVVGIDMRIEAGFNQTPGPGAGLAL